MLTTPDDQHATLNHSSRGDTLVFDDCNNLKEQLQHLKTPQDLSRSSLTRRSLSAIKEAVALEGFVDRRPCKHHIYAQ
jgi:hypothetical protein